MPEVIDAPETQKSLAAIAEKSGLPSAIAESLVTTFVPLAEKAARIIAGAESIVVTDATQVSEMKASRTARLALREVRVDIDKARKALKEESLRRGQAIDAVAGDLRERIEPVELRLEEQEKFAERAEAARKAQLKASRETLLAPFKIDTTFYNLAEMPEATFSELLDSTRTAHEARIAAAKKAEEDRIAAEVARKAEEERIRIENAKLAAEKAEADRLLAETREAARKEALAAQARADAERQKVEAEKRAAEAKARAEREAAEARERREREDAERKLREERAHREKLEREAAEAKAKAEAKAREEEQARKKAARAPDKVKITAVATALRGLALPEVSSPEAVDCVGNIRAKLEQFAKWVEAQAATL